MSINMYDSIYKPKVTPDGSLKIIESPTEGGIIFLDTAFDLESLSSDLNKTTLSTKSGKDFLGKQIDKFAAKSVEHGLNINNINSKNNVVEFISSNTGSTVHSVTIIEGMYNTATDLMDALVIALNSATGASGLTFSHGTSSENNLIHILSSSGGSYYFTLNSSHLCMLRGKFLYNLPRSQTLQTSKFVGSIWGFYTRYVDVVSFTLTQNERILASCAGPRQGSNLLYRIFLKEDQRSNQRVITESIDVLRWIYKDRHKSIISLDIELYDEFGLPLEVKKYDPDTPVNSWVNLTLLSQ